MVYNPTEVKINMKLIEKDGKCYFIGNCNMDIGLLGTVIKFYPPRDEDGKYGSLSINQKQAIDYEVSQAKEVREQDGD